jgi:hypothetical protein
LLYHFLQRRKNILSLPLSQRAVARHHLEGLWFETELFWGLENKEQLWPRESWYTLPQCLGRRQPKKVIAKRKSV